MVKTAELRAGVAEIHERADAVRTIVEILQDIQSELKAPKSQTNTFGNYKYRKCEDILEALKPILKKHQAAVVIKDEIVQFGERVYIKATATLMQNGSVIETVALAREPNERKGMDASQITGATSSYARKYALNGLFLIDDSQDPDSSNNGHHESAKITGAQLGQLRDLLIYVGDESKEGAFAKFLGVESLESLPSDKFNTALTILTAKKAKKDGAK
jgi:hypothetical protein